MLPLLAIGALAGLGKSLLIDGPKEERQRKLAAETQRLSPWTGLKAEPVQEADPLGSALSFGLAGAQLGQGMEQADLNEAMMKKQMEFLDRQNAAPMIPAYGMTSPYGSIRTMGY